MGLSIIQTTLWFIESNLFIGFVTFAAGLIAFGVYKTQKSDSKKDAALILLSEIRNAEKSISQIKNTGELSEAVFVMPESSWSKFQHFFVSDLDVDELVLINDFYNFSILIQKELNMLNNQLDLAQEEKIKLTQSKLLELAEKHAGNKSEYEKQKNIILNKGYWLENAWFSPNAPKQKILRYANSVRFVTTSTCGKKLKQISNSSTRLRFYQGR